MIAGTRDGISTKEASTESDKVDYEGSDGGGIQLDAFENKPLERAPILNKATEGEPTKAKEIDAGGR